MADLGLKLPGKQQVTLDILLHADNGMTNYD
jgi:hypothetical protein